MDEFRPVWAYDLLAKAGRARGGRASRQGASAGREGKWGRRVTGGSGDENADGPNVNS